MKCYLLELDIPIYLYVYMYKYIYAPAQVVFLLKLVKNTSVDNIYTYIHILYIGGELKSRRI